MLIIVKTINDCIKSVWCFSQHQCRTMSSSASVSNMRQTLSVFISFAFCVFDIPSLIPFDARHSTSAINIPFVSTAKVFSKSKRETFPISIVRLRIYAIWNTFLSSSSCCVESSIDSVDMACSCVSQINAVASYDILTSRQRHMHREKTIQKSHQNIERTQHFRMWCQIGDKFLINTKHHLDFVSKYVGVTTPKQRKTFSIFRRRHSDLALYPHFVFIYIFANYDERRKDFSVISSSKFLSIFWQWSMATAAARAANATVSCVHTLLQTCI